MLVCRLVTHGGCDVSWSTILSSNQISVDAAKFLQDFCTDTELSVLMISCDNFSNSHVSII